MVWKHILYPNNILVSFLEINRYGLIGTTNSNQAKEFFKVPRGQVFSLVCWLLWMSRSRFVFEGTVQSTRDIIHQCTYSLMESLPHEEHWSPPPSDVISVDVDCSVRVYHQAASGGVLRNNMGHWIMVFIKTWVCVHSHRRRFMQSN